MPSAKTTLTMDGTRYDAAWARAIATAGASSKAIEGKLAAMRAGIQKMPDTPEKNAAIVKYWAFRNRALSQGLAVEQAAELASAKLTAAARLRIAAESRVAAAYERYMDVGGRLSRGQSGAGAARDELADALRAQRAFRDIGSAAGAATGPVRGLSLVMRETQLDTALAKAVAASEVAGRQVARNLSSDLPGIQKMADSLTAKLNSMRDAVGNIPAGPERVAAEAAYYARRTQLQNTFWAMEKGMRDRALAEQIAGDKITAAQRLRLRAEDRVAQGYMGVAIMGGSSATRGAGGLAQTARDELAHALRAQRAFRDLGAAAGGAVGGVSSMTGAVREAMVILREIGRGNWARVPGSVTLLVQYLGGNLVKALLTIPGAVAVVGAAIAYFTYRHLKDLNEALDKTAERFEKGFAEVWRKAGVEAMGEGARAAADLDAHLNKLGRSHEDLAESTRESISAMEEELALMRELRSASGENKGNERAEEQSKRKAELELVEKNLKAQKDRLELSKNAVKKATEEAHTGGDAVERAQRLAAMKGESGDSDETIRDYKKIQKELQAKVDAAAKPYEGREHPIPEFADSARKRASDETFKTSGGEMHSLNQINGLLEKEIANRTNREKEEIRLGEVQRALADALSEAKEKTNQDNGAVESLTKERDKLKQSIALHAKYDPQISAEESAKKAETLREKEFDESLKGMRKPEKERALRGEIALWKSKVAEDTASGKTDKAAEDLEKQRKYEAELKGDEMKQGGRGGISHNKDQSVGAYSNTSNTLQTMAHHLANIERNTGHLNPPVHPAVDHRGTSHGGVFQ